MMRGTGPVPAAAFLASPAGAEPCEDGMAHAVGDLMETLPGMGSFIETRGPQLQQADAALPDIFETLNRTRRWNLPDEGPMLLRARIDAVGLGYGQNRPIARILNGDLAFERTVAAKMKAAVEAIQLGCGPMEGGR